MIITVSARKLNSKNALIIEINHQARIKDLLELIRVKFQEEQQIVAIFKGQKLNEAPEKTLECLGIGNGALLVVMPLRTTATATTTSSCEQTKKEEARKLFSVSIHAAMDDNENVEAYCHQIHDSILKVLAAPDPPSHPQHYQWQERGWRSGLEFDLCLRRGLGSEHGRALVVKGRPLAECERISAMLESIGLVCTLHGPGASPELPREDPREWSLSIGGGDATNEQNITTCLRSAFMDFHDNNADSNQPRSLLWAKCGWIHGEREMIREMTAGFDARGRGLIAHSLTQQECIAIKQALEKYQVLNPLMMHEPSNPLPRVGPDIQVDLSACCAAGGERVYQLLVMAAPFPERFVVTSLCASLGPADPPHHPAPYTWPERGFLCFEQLLAEWKKGMSLRGVSLISYNATLRECQVAAARMQARGFECKIQNKDDEDAVSIILTEEDMPQVAAAATTRILMQRQQQQQQPSQSYLSSFIAYYRRVQQLLPGFEELFEDVRVDEGLPKASQNFIDNLKSPQAILADEMCSVCCDVLRREDENVKNGDANENTIVQVDCCRAIYHKTCVTKWLKLHSSCPNCRHVVEADEEEQRRHQMFNLATAMHATDNWVCPGCKCNNGQGSAVCNCCSVHRNVWPLAVLVESSLFRRLACLVAFSIMVRSNQNEQDLSLIQYERKRLLDCDVVSRLETMGWSIRDSMVQLLEELDPTRIATTTTTLDRNTCELVKHMLHVVQEKIYPPDNKKMKRELPRMVECDLTNGHSDFIQMFRMSLDESTANQLMQQESMVSYLKECLKSGDATIEAWSCVVVANISAFVQASTLSRNGILAAIFALPRTFSQKQQISGLLHLVNNLVLDVKALCEQEQQELLQLCLDIIIMTTTASDTFDVVTAFRLASSLLKTIKSTCISHITVSAMCKSLYSRNASADVWRMFSLFQLALVTRQNNKCAAA